MAPSVSNLPFQFFILLFIINLAPTELTNSISPPSSSAASSSSIHDVLESHGLPIGLFPISISEFSLDPASGRFQLHVTNSPCDAKFETHVRYDWNVTGTISYGQISELSGVAAQELFLWFPVKTIQVDIPSSGLIYFDVGVVSKQFSLSFFETPHDCAATVSEEGGDGHDNKWIDLSFLKGRGRIIENPSLKERNKVHEWRAAS